MRSTISFFLTGLLIGFLALTQYNNYNRVTDIVNRNDSSDIANEIDLLLIRNKNSQTDLIQQQEVLDNLKNDLEAAKTVQRTILNYQMFAGEIPIKGPGVVLRIENNLSSIWIIDIVNEFINAGAESVSINDFRLGNNFNGFLTTKDEQILLAGKIITSPFEFKVIGDVSNLEYIIRQPGGLIDRLKINYEDDLVYYLNTKKEIVMNKIEQ